MEESTEQKPHIEKNPQMNSQNSNNSSEKTDSNSSGKKLETLPCYNPNSKVPSFSKLLQDVVMAANSSVTLDPSVKTIGFEGKFGPSHQEALANVTAKASEKDKFSFRSDEPLGDVPRTPKSDGYSWRKYGQKQLKGSGSSRSYYRCTSISCNVKKKVQHVDLSGEVIDVVYKGNHNHDPPQHLRAINRKKDSAPRALHNFSESFVGNVPHSLAFEGGLKHLVPSTHECEDKNMIDAVETSPKDVEEQQSKAINTISSIRCESEPAILQAVEERSGSRSDNSCENAMIDPMKVLEVAPLKKRRLKEKVKVSSEPVYRTFKDPKVVVLADKDAGMSDDGYRWRKYGQKMVKGTPHPRSYYRCSSLGCPVRKHVERATDSSAILVTYEGEHDHDIPTPKRPHHTAENKHVEEQTKDPKGSETRGGNALEPEPSPGPDLKGSETRGGDVSESEPSLGEDPKGSETHGGNVLGSKSSLGEDPKGSETCGDFGLGTSAHIESEPSLEEDQKGSETHEGNVLESERGLGEDQKRSESGGDKVLESARTLLSFGIELKSC